MRNFVACCAILLAATISFVTTAAFARGPSNAEMIARGKYLVSFGACNDCHTPGWREQFGNVPVKSWMIGSPIGFRGPWGTVYAANVRERFSEISEQDWLAMIKTRDGHPPMTWHDLRALTLDDQRAIYRFVRSLGKAGPPSLASVPPQREPTTPYFMLATPGPR